ncbi:metallophosphoesterase [Geodermatophilus chilensis]|uniref:metallophosphoesterase n=1 Tax=Geodermatophilus chilensis TaxID=2035835 RepID=UPI000C25BE32|nr:metallophosphoesterase [Geodermatophilus chilensis]
MSEPSTTTRPRLRAAARGVGRWAVRLAVVLAGAWLGILLLGRVSAPIGPFDATVAFRPLGGGAALDIPPLGALQVDAYDGPLRLEIQLSRVDEIRATQLATDPTKLDGVVDQVSADLRDAVERVAWLTALAAVGGGTVAALLVLRRRREPLIALGLSTALVAATGGVAAATWRPEALSRPTYTGLLVNANSLIGSAQDIVARFDAYRASLEDLVTNVSSLYSTLSTLPPPGGADDSVAVLHVSDIHLNPAGFDLVQQVVTQFDVDGVLDTGDITDWGSQPENGLISAVGALDVPYVYTRGNHDSTVTAQLVAAQPNATVLDDSAVTVAGLTIVGAPDPRFTPDQNADDGIETLEESGEGLAEFVEPLPETPAIAMVHDPEQALPLDGVVPLVLAGHTHEREVTRLDGGTLLMVQGSTGGAGLRALQGEFPEPLTCTVLYLNPRTGALTAYDEITLGGLGQTEVTIEREVVPAAATAVGDGVPPTPTTPAPTPLPAPASPTG